MPGIELLGRTVQLTLTPAAQRALTQRSTPLLAEMELYFSCLVRKRVRFHEHAAEHPAAASALPGLALSFRPVTTAHCRIEDAGSEVPTTDMPVVKPSAYVPHWLRIDYRKGRWSGEFGYDRALRSG